MLPPPADSARSTAPAFPERACMLQRAKLLGEHLERVPETERPYPVPALFEGLAVQEARDAGDARHLGHVEAGVQIVQHQRAGLAVPEEPSPEVLARQA